MKPAILYARFSPRPGDSQTDTITAQLAACTAHCNAHGMTVIQALDDQELSGATVTGRPGLATALELACQHKAALVVYSLSRLARNTADAIAISQRLNDAGADLVSLKEQLDTTTPMGRMMFTLMAAMAQLEREQISQRTSDAMRHYQKNGRRMSAHCPYGWNIDPRDPARMVKNDAEQQAIAMIITARKNDYSLRAIGDLLVSKGLPSRTGKWTHSTIANILEREGE